MFSILGSVFCSIICYILPALFYLRATHSNRAGKGVFVKRFISFAILLFGAAIGTFGTYSTLASS